MKRLKKDIWLIPVLVVGLLLLGTTVWAEPPVKVRLTTSKQAYLVGEPIKMQIGVYNDSGLELCTRKGFLDEDFHLMLSFLGPDGEHIQTKDYPAQFEPTSVQPKINGFDAVVAEKLPAGDARYSVVTDAKAFYTLDKPGRYRVLLRTDFDAFTQCVPDANVADRYYAYLKDQSYYDLISNRIAFEIVPPDPVIEGNIYAYVNMLTIQGTGNNPGASKDPLEGVWVSLFKTADAEAAGFVPINYKTYPAIANLDPVYQAKTDSSGLAVLEGVVKDDYVALADYPAPDFKHLGSVIEADNNNWGTAEPIRTHFTVMVKPDKKKVAGKTTRRTGSELLITEPEFVTWDQEQEFYPFVFETLGEWGVTTSVEPPEGFVADAESLAADVTNEVEAVQFVITDIGSKWEETGVTFNIDHKGKKEKIKHKVGIKLSKKLAKKKGLPVYGHTKSPGNLKGGKKVKKEMVGGDL